MFAHVAEQDGRIVAIAVWFLNFSTWTGRHGIYLEDLFVDPEVRGGGIADGLFRALAAEARARDCARIDWAVLDWNDLAKGFYRRIGGRQNRRGRRGASTATPSPPCSDETPSLPCSDETPSLRSSDDATRPTRRSMTCSERSAGSCSERSSPSG